LEKITGQSRAGDDGAKRRDFYRCQNFFILFLVLAAPVWNKNKPNVFNGFYRRLMGAGP
jgi:hypothetical protein